MCCGHAFKWNCLKVTKIEYKEYNNLQKKNIGTFIRLCVSDVPFGNVNAINNIYSTKNVYVLTSLNTQ